tara:strand:+ start:940 stop:1830 length:891 start_codon:yes stop_codon:yes gene_type:complete
MQLKVGVLMGGPSQEREVSIDTGQAVMKACSYIGFDSTEIAFDKDYKSLIGIMKEQDIVFNALHGGIGENGKIQTWMNNNQIKYTGSDPSSSALCMNKSKSKKIAKENGVATARWQLLCHKDEPISIRIPFVVKPNEQGSTFGLSIVYDKREILPAIEKAFQYGKEIVVEEYIEGRELTVPIVGEEVYPVLEIKPTHKLYDYECKYTPGMTEYICPANLEKNIIVIIQKSTKLLFDCFGCSIYARADFILDHSGVPFFLEMNTLPGMTSTSLVPKSANANGVSFEELIRTIIMLSI